MTILRHNFHRKKSIGSLGLSSIARTFSQVIAMGYTPMAAIDFLLKQSTDKRITGALSSVAADIRAGTTLPAAFEKHEYLFGAFFCRLMTLGASTGKFAPLFARLAEYYEKDHDFNKKMLQKIKISSLMVTGSIGCIAALLLFLMFTAVSRTSLSIENVPHVTRLIVSIASLLHAHSGTILLLSSVLFLLLIGLLFTDLPFLWIKRIPWNIPFFGDMVHKDRLRRFSYACSLLLSAGIDFPSALRTAATELKNASYSMKIVRIAERKPQEISSLLGELRTINLYPPLVLDMIREARSPADSGVLFEKIGEFYQEEIQAVVAAVTLVIEPAVVLVLGLVSAGFLIAFYLPMLKGA